jgi:mono/diheme cytochrome c family protein
MRAIWLLHAAATAAALFGFLTAGPAAAQSAALVESGREEFQRYCAACHGTEAHGDGPVAASLKKAPPDLTLIASRRGGKFKSVDIASYIDGRFEVAAHGERLMPVWGRILGEPIAEGTTADEVSRGRIDALVSYLNSIQR